LCADFKVHGDCEKGDLCSYAHEATDVRQMASMQQASTPPLRFAYHAMNSPTKVCESVGKQAGVAVSSCVAIPMQSQFVFGWQLSSAGLPGHKPSSQKQLTPN